MTCTVYKLNSKSLVDSQWLADFARDYHSLDETVEELFQRHHHLKECLREIAPLILSANFGEERYPLAYAECKALAGKENERDGQTL